MEVLVLGRSCCTGMIHTYKCIYTPISFLQFWAFVKLLFEVSTSMAAQPCLCSKNRFQLFHFSFGANFLSHWSFSLLSCKSEFMFSFQCGAPESQWAGGLGCAGERGQEEAAARLHMGSSSIPVWYWASCPVREKILVSQAFFCKLYCYYFLFHKSTIY